LLIVGNIFRDTMGWSYVSEERQKWSGGAGSDVRGRGGFGLDIDTASGVHLYRNIFYNNAHSGVRLAGKWRDGEILCYNNVIANSLYGLRLAGAKDHTHPSVDTQVVNNIVVNNEGYGILQNTAAGHDQGVAIDYNLYYANGWRSREDGGLWNPGHMSVQSKSAGNGYYPTLSDIRAATPWETHGREGAPLFLAYDVNDRHLDDGSWPSFFLTADSTRAIDQGSSLPDSLTRLMDSFGVRDSYWGRAYDIGHHEWGNIRRMHLPLVVKQLGR
jgi:hypothetical protein